MTPNRKPHTHTCIPSPPTTCDFSSLYRRCDSHCLNRFDFIESQCFFACCSFSLSLFWLFFFTLLLRTPSAHTLCFITSFVKCIGIGHMHVSVILVFILRWLYAFFVIAVAVAVIIVNGDVRTVTVCTGRMIGWFSRLMKPNFIIFDTDTQLFLLMLV